MHKQQISEVVGCNRSVSILQPQDRQEKGMLDMPQLLRCSQVAITAASSRQKPCTSEDRMKLQTWN